MTQYLRHIIYRLVILLLAVTDLCAQPKIIDRVVAVVGDNMILQSDIESLYLQYRAQEQAAEEDMKCKILEEFLSQKLLINQAKIDSVEVSESQVEIQLDSRLQYFINQIGSQENLEKYFNKSIYEIKNDLRKVVRDKLITDEMHKEVTGKVRVTPSEVRQLYNSLDEDSIPFIDSQIEISQIVVYPPVSEEAIYQVKQQLLDLRKRIIDGENFATLAVLYSQDGSSRRGGELDYMGKAELDPEYAKAAFSLKKNGISTIVESAAGYHIIQLIDRQDERVRTRHILMKPKPDPLVIERTIGRLDSIANLIRTDSISFENAARYFSQDNQTNVNGGLRINPLTNTTRFKMDELEPAEYSALKDMEVGEISQPVESMDENGKTVYKIIKINNRTKPHRANLKDDYMVLQEMALAKKKDMVFNDWLQEKILSTHVQIDDSYKGCDFLYKGWVR